MKMLFSRLLLFGLFSCIIGFPSFSQTGYPTPVEDDFMIRDFRFETGESLPELRIHYTTVGQPVKDKSGKVTNAVLIMHGTTGNGHQFLSNQFAGGLFKSGQLLDASKYFIILPDGIGHGKSSKPSDGLHMHFPRYTYMIWCWLNTALLQRSWALAICAW